MRENEGKGKPADGSVGDMHVEREREGRGKEGGEGRYYTRIDVRTSSKSYVTWSLRGKGGGGGGGGGKRGREVGSVGLRRPGNAKPGVKLQREEKGWKPLVTLKQFQLLLFLLLRLFLLLPSFLKAYCHCRPAHHMFI